MYRHWYLSLYQPIMEATKAIRDVDSDGQTRTPVYEFGQVLRRGKDLPNGTNLADYVGDLGTLIPSGTYDHISVNATDSRSNMYSNVFVFRFWIDAGEAHEDGRLESLSLKFMAQFALHVSAEMGTENMFSGSGHFYDPRKIM